MNHRYAVLFSRLARFVAMVGIGVGLSSEAEAQLLSPARVATDSAIFVPTPRHLDFGIVPLNGRKDLSLTISNPGKIGLYVTYSTDHIVGRDFVVIVGSAEFLFVPSRGSDSIQIIFYSRTAAPDGPRPGAFGGSIRFFHNVRTFDITTSSVVTWSAMVPSATATQNVAPNTATDEVPLGDTGLRIKFSSTGTGGTMTVNTVPGTPAPGPAREGGVNFTPTGNTWVIRSSGLTGATFDLTFPNAGGANARLAFRPEGSPPGTPWTLIEPGKTQITGNVIIARGVTSTSEWTVVVPGTLAPTITEVSPSVEIAGIRLNVIVRGTNFGPTSTFDFGAGITVNSVEVASVTEAIVNITIAADAVSGLRDVKVTNPPPGGGTATLAGGFRVGALAPTLASVTPNAADRGTVVKVRLAGTNFLQSATTVSVGGGITVDSVVVDGSSSLAARFTIPTTTAAGTYDVTVSNGAVGSATLTGGFTVRNPAPTLASVSPTSGALGQTLNVTVNGSNFFSSATTFDFGPGIVVNNVSLVSSSQAIVNITITASAATGLRNVTVTNPSPGGGTATLTGAFSVVVAAPTVTAISPAAGDRGTTLSVTLTGSNFASGVTTVAVGGGIVVLRVTVVSPTSLTADLSIPLSTRAGVYDVTVSNGAVGSATLAGAFTARNLAPTIVSLAPSTGKQGATVAVTISGTNFETGVTTAVSFGAGITVTSFSVVSSTQIAATITIAQNAAIGVRDVTVTNASPGGGTATRTGGFTVEPLTSIEPLPGLVPETYVLYDAFPNPFNPSTTIRYGVPERSDVLVQIYDLAGKLVADLVRLETTAGLFQVKWEAGNASSGTYIVRMTARSLESEKTYSGSSKVVLVR